MRRSQLLFDAENRPTEAFAHFLRDVQIPGEDLATIDAALQQRFFQKGADGQPLERWELQEVGISCPPEQFRRHLENCGFGLETIPSKWQYAYAAWPGALLLRVVARLQDLIKTWTNGFRWNETIVFGGKRPLQTDRETPREAYSLLDKAYDIPDAEESRFVATESKPELTFLIHGVRTELDMMRWIWKHADMPQELRDTAVFVDAPMKPPATPGGNPVRPSTEDTIREWLGSNPAPGSFLLSSGAPYGMAQDEAFWMLLEPRGYTVETFGHAAPELGIEVFMREVAGTVNRIRRARLEGR